MALAVALICAAASTFAATAVLAPSKDTTIYGSGDAALSNGAGAALFAGRSGQNRTLRSLLAFNLSSIPAGATVTSATLTLTVNTPHNDTVALQARRLLADWGEGSSAAPSGGGGGAPATTGDATWVSRFFNTLAWITPGGDYAATVSATQTVSGSSGSVTLTTSALAADVQAWVDQPATNFGWLLRAADETAAAVRFSSRQGASPPSLVVNYTVAAALSRHSADTSPADGQLSLEELTRVIELFNTRHDGERTGCYRVQDGTVDGFAPDSTRDIATAVTLSRYHSADTNVAGARDGRIGLIELTRVIALYNYRNGSTRTGEYHVSAGTEDGFSAGP